jgi:phage shock protein PspC (stress-responsive transcriptional regulator)
MNQPTTGPRRLRRSRNDRYIGGVCGGVADYLNMDANLVRVLTVVLTLFTGVPVVAYLVALFLLPEEDVVPRAPVGQVGDPVWGAGGPPWSQAPGTQTPPSTWGSAPEAPPVPAPADPPRREDGTF